MAQITLQGNPIHTIGNLPQVGTKTPDFKLTKTDLSDISLQDVKGKRVILNIFPSLDTGICAASVRKFNQEVTALENTVVVNVSKDLPFAHGRFCTAEGIENVISTSVLRTDCSFSEDYQVGITDGPMAGLLSRAVVILNENGEIIYTEQVPEIVQEPDYAKALDALK
jgi:thiol peroxidase